MKFSKSDELKHGDSADLAACSVHIHTPGDIEGVVSVDKLFPVSKNKNINRYGSMRRSLSEVCHKIL